MHRQVVASGKQVPADSGGTQAPGSAILRVFAALPGLLGVAGALGAPTGLYW